MNSQLSRNDDACPARNAVALMPLPPAGRWNISCCLAIGFLLLSLSVSSAAESQLVVDLSSSTGAITYGASGWLYGQAEDGIPTDNMMSPLKPQISAQKPADGLQHPAGDAFHVAPAYKRAGGKEIQIYLQDFYPDWTYNDLGIDDYLQKVNVMVRRVVADPNHDLFSYVPFNEPDNNWYGYSGESLQRLLSDWKKAYLAIRAIDPKAKIVGPNYYNYRPETYRAFMTFARDNHVLPDEVSWHELQDNFFPGWYDRFNDYRSLEKGLGIAPIPIVINEYARSRDDLAVPGKMVQWIARLEDSKVNGCLAYWVPSGSLSDLVARTWPNRATGAWWLYKWYGGMTGNTVSVTPPDRYGFQLQGLAAVDADKKQARIIFGGAAGTVNVAIKGFNSAPYLGGAVHVAVWGVDNSGIEPSSGPSLRQEADYPISSGQITVPVTDTIVSSAYYLVVTPATRLASVSLPNRYEAEYADLSGSAAISYGGAKGYTGTGFVEGYKATGDAAAQFAITAIDDGYYDLTLRFASAAPGAARRQKIGVDLNGSQLTALDLSAAPDANGWASQKRALFLAGGINLISFKALSDGSSDGLRIDALDVTRSTGPSTTYEAENPQNTRAGTAIVTGSDTASGGIFVTQIGGGNANFLQFNNVTVPSSGNYKMVVSYTNDEKGHKGQVERYAEISVNGHAATKQYFRNTFDQSVFRTRVVDVELNGGANTVRFSNADGNAPDVDKIQIAAQSQ